jgi:hypothetical protein
MSLVDLALSVDEELERGELVHAFGGALALAYLTEPRGTADVDVNVFIPVENASRVIDTLARLGLRPDRSQQDWIPAAGIRFRRQVDPYAVDVFLSTDEAHAEVERRTEWHPFGPEGRLLPFLSAEDLVVFKLSFGRDKDWVDLRRIAAVRPDLDLDYVERQLLALRGPRMYPRLARMRRLLRVESERKSP